MLYQLSYLGFFASDDGQRRRKLALYRVLQLKCEALFRRATREDKNGARAVSYRACRPLFVPTLGLFVGPLPVLERPKLLGDALVAVFVRVAFAAADHVGARHPPAKVDVGAARRAERAHGMNRRLPADRASPAGRFRLLRI